MIELHGLQSERDGPNMSETVQLRVPEWQNSHGQPSSSQQDHGAPEEVRTKHVHRYGFAA
jgi:hypothetical protein